MIFNYDEKINDIVGIPEKKDKVILKNILDNYIKYIHGDNLKIDRLLQKYNEKIEFQTHTCLLDANEVFDSIANDLIFVKIIFNPSDFFEKNEWTEYILKLQKNYKR